MKNIFKAHGVLKYDPFASALLRSAAFILFAAWTGVLFSCPVSAAADGRSVAAGPRYLWPERSGESGSLESRIPPPPGFKRSSAEAGSFAEWLRGLPLKEGRPPVRLYDKSLKGNQDAHFAVVAIDCGNRDLQQCADAIMRLRAEYFFSRGEFDAIKFAVGDGRAVSFEGWLESRPAGASRKADRANFQRYMTYIFAYAGTHSLSKSLQKVGGSDKMRIGDVFIKGGFPGHAVLVCDIAENAATGERVFMLLQSYMPAQDVHILKNPSDERLSPWYRENYGETLRTPEWDFKPGQLMRFN